MDSFAWNIIGLLFVLPMIMVGLFAILARWRGRYVRRQRVKPSGFWLHSEQHIKRL